jgi:flavin reductase (DIM6/NTAB) family NADH-FMN oxidoreductase RutF
MPTFDQQALRAAYGCFPSGVTALCALVDGRPVGTAASSFSSVSLEPPLVSICLQRKSATWRKLQAAARLGVSVLSEAHAIACRQLASKADDRFAGIQWNASAEGAVFIEGSSAWLDCSIFESFCAGDHEIVLLRVEGFETSPGISPLIFHASRFKQLSLS